MTKKNYQALTLVINYYVFLYYVLGAGLLFLVELSSVALALSILVWIYLLPPFICRVLITLFGRPIGTANTRSGLFLYWWFLTQLQIPYTRFPFLTELLRIIPGAYSFWLNLWGAHVSLLTYWSPSITVTDYYLINIGRGTLLGGNCRIGGHLIVREDSGEQTLILAPMHIGKNAMIGMNAAVGPGSHVHDNESLPVGKLLKPFYSWKDGQIQRPKDGSDDDTGS